MKNVFHSLFGWGVVIFYVWHLLHPDLHLTCFISSRCFISCFISCSANTGCMELSSIEAFDVFCLCSTFYFHPKLGIVPFMGIYSVSFLSNNFCLIWTHVLFGASWSIWYPCQANHRTKTRLEYYVILFADRRTNRIHCDFTKHFNYCQMITPIFPSVTFNQVCSRLTISINKWWWNPNPKGSGLLPAPW